MVKSKRKIFAPVSIILLALAFVCVSAFSINAKAESGAATRIDFSDKTLYETSGTVTEENGVTLAANASVSSKETFGDFMTYVTVSVPDGGSVAVGFGGNKSIVFSASGISSSLTVTEEGDGFEFADLADNGVIMLFVLGNRAEVGVAAKDDADNALHVPKIVYELPSSAAGKVTVSAGDKSVSVKSMDIYGLGASIDAPNGDYDENGWRVPEKPTLETETKTEENNGDSGCGSSVSASCAIAAAVLFAAAITLSVKRRRAE